jgi:TetR/AcrR family transcriptional regulator
MSTRDRILDAAEARFAAAGFGATSLADIAGDVGIRPPSLYRHFSSKRALYEEVLSRLLTPWMELLATIIQPTDADHAVSNLRVAVEHYLSTPNLARLVQHAALAGGDDLELVRQWFAPMLDLGKALSSSAPDPEGMDPAMVMVAFHAMLSGYLTLAPLHADVLGGDPLNPVLAARYQRMLEAFTRALWAF